MSNKFNGKQCVYCESGQSTKSGDHIFPRKLFLEHRRGNLPKVPCCKICNDKKSTLEHYLLTILPFGARHADALENLTSQVSGRLDQNVSLHKKLYQGQGIQYIKNKAGLFVPSMTIPINTNKLTELFNYIARALANFHFNVRILGDELTISSIDLNIDSLLSGKVKKKVNNDLGNGTVVYRGVQANDNDKITAWEFIIYGGLQIGGQNARKIVSFTGPQNIFDNVRRRERFEI
jgi:hypothetical protein